MAEKLSLRSDGDGNIYVYIEDTAGASLAFGADSANGVVALNTLATENVQPNEATANMTIDPTANGDILFRPHGTGKTEFNTGDVQITEKSLYLPHTDTDGVNGCIFTRHPDLGYQRTISFPDDWNVVIGKGLGGVYTWPNQIGISYNVVIGSEGAMSSLTGGANDHVVIGRTAMKKFTGDLLTTPSNNISIGALTLENLLTGSHNIALGRSSGISYTTSESNNICLSNQGTTGDNGVTRIGTSGQQTKAFVAGIHGVTPGGASQQLAIIDSSGQMGSTSGGAFTTNTYNADSGSATPSAGAISILGSGGTSTSASGSTVTITSTAPAMVLLQTATASTSANLVLSTGISSTYACYFVACNNLVYDNGANPTLRVEYSNDGGSTWIATNYNAAYLINTWNSAALTNVNSTTICPLAVSASGAGNQISGWLYFQGLGGSGKTLHEGRFFGQNVHFQAYGWNSANNTINALRFSYSAGNITSGTISLYGLTK